MVEIYLDNPALGARPVDPAFFGGFVPAHGSPNDVFLSLERWAESLSVDVDTIWARVHRPGGPSIVKAIETGPRRLPVLVDDGIWLPDLWRAAISECVREHPAAAEFTPFVAVHGGCLIATNRVVLLRVRLLAESFESLRWRSVGSLLPYSLGRILAAGDDILRASATTVRPAVAGTPCLLLDAKLLRVVELVQRASKHAHCAVDIPEHAEGAIRFRIGCLIEVIFKPCQSV